MSANKEKYTEMDNSVLANWPMLWQRKFHDHACVVGRV
ncbi:hypothetical protein AB7M49_005999 [Bradyrhizobium elkanii]